MLKRQFSSVMLCTWMALWGCDDGQEGPEQIVDAAVGAGGAGGQVVLPDCQNGEDDDADGLVDLDDPGCDDPDDDDETNILRTECNDGEDNDGDGLIDRADPACRSANDDDESADPPPPQCDNGEDDDDDGAIDLEDRGCASSQDDDESDEPPLPECSNGEDDDQDGFTDFPDDPGCGSEFDDDEGDEGGPPLPQCGNGIDDDNDGRVDLADPGCASPADPRETDPSPEDGPPTCFNGLDDDEDGITDFPLDPGCAAAGDDSEVDDPNRPPACGNGVDDDGDGLVDYPLDPGCAGVGDRDETDPPVTPACFDRIDNDRDGQIDYPADRGCESAADGTETGSCGRTYDPVEIDGGRQLAGSNARGAFQSQGSCGGAGSPEVVYLYRVERTLESLRITTDFPGTEVETALYVRRGCLDPRTEVACRREPLDDGVAANTLVIQQPAAGDYYIFVDAAAGIGGRYQLLVEEVPLAQCLNRIDDDDDGRIDYPADPGCQRASDRDETDPDPLPACSNDEDDDGDGLVDYPLDVGCRSAADDDEVDLCGDGIRFFQYPVGDPFIIDDTSMGGSNGFAGSCGGQGAVEKVFLYENPFNARLTFSVEHEETIDNTLVYVRSACLGAELGCSAANARDPLITKGTVTVDRAAPGDYFVFVDHRFGLGGRFKLSVNVERLPAGCADARDNDEDGFIDADDVGCADPEDEDERDPPEGELPECWNGEDDDEDGIVDYPFEPGCVGKGDDDEEDPAQVAQCSNGVDDDEDGATDFPADIGCAARGDLDEEDPRNRPQCSNRIDDDMDGTTDYPVDPGCAAAGDPSETDDEIAPACANGEDDDRDGLVDYPFDPGCIAAGHVSEVDPDPLPACSNREDDDGDGEADFPFDPGCTWAADPDEADPAFPPQCANNLDDDGNGRIDFPDDPGCRFAGDVRELTEGPVQPRCSDGVDNDRDGVVDLADVGCLNARDNDEIDPEVDPFCADGQDNDEDNVIDWPDDPGCAAQGDECEQFGYGRCDGVCVPLVDNAFHCGRCGRVCSAGVQCIEGRCGELREVILRCGNSGRDINQFIRGDLAEAEVRVVVGCRPDDETQAILVPRGGVNLFRAEIATILPWVEGGGIVITEYNISDDIYNMLFNANVAQGARGGRCTDNIQPVVQFSPQDVFWQDNEFQPLPEAQSGCGFSIANIPGVVPLGGWDQANVSLGYVELGAGRVWLVEADWQDNQNITDASLDLMAYMIAGGAVGGGLPPCIDGRDNDEDGAVDAEDTGCTGPGDEEEGDPPAGPPACGNGVDDDRDGDIDFPNDLGCIAAGDDDETDPPDVPQCGNGLDDDGDGSPDYPFDRGCQGRGDADERDPLRLPQCGNNRDDDADGLVDFPADPGCASAADAAEEDDLPLPACANGADDDRDGITDWPFDVGCLSARDNDETDPPANALPQCQNRIDDDEDGLTDFPADPGCAWTADPRESDGVVRPQCANEADDDGDNLVDWPEDRGCFFAGDTSEVDPFNIPARCGNGVDDDGDGSVDLQDVGCANAEDDDEDDPVDGPLCANEIDDDDDGLTDWPADPGCQARGDDGEDQSCRAEIEVPLIPANGTVMGSTLEDGDDLFRNRCGGREAPDAVYRYDLAARADLTISADNPGTDYPVVLSVRRDCEEPLSQLACAGDFRAPDPVLTLENAEPGAYYIVVDGGGPERWIGSRNPQIPLPVDPRAFQARNDFRVNCGWGDAGSDAFDCYGRIRVTFGGAQSPELDPTIVPDERQGAAGAYQFRYTSELLGNVWRFRILPAVENDERRVTVTVTGNLGSDGGTVSAQRMVAFQGRQLTYLHTSDNFAAPRDPPVYHLIVPSDPAQLGAVNYAINRDNPTVTATDVTLPVTFYVGLHYAPNQAGWNAVSAAIVRDIEVQAGGGGADAARFGNFELSVTEE